MYICQILRVLLVDFGKVLCSSANEPQQNSNASSREDYMTQILTVLLEIFRVYIWPLWPFVSVKRNRSKTFPIVPVNKFQSTFKLQLMILAAITILWAFLNCFLLFLAIFLIKKLNIFTFACGASLYFDVI